MVHKRGLGRKLSLFIAVTVILTLLLSTLVGYLWGFNLLLNTLVNYNNEIIDLISQNISEKINSEIIKAESIIGDPDLINAVEESNKLCEEMGKSELERRMQETERLWNIPDAGNPIIDKYINNKVSIKLKTILERNKDLSEIFVTNRFGSMVAMSGKTSDFYQADEKWWQGAFNNGRGAIFIGDIALDESSMTKGATLALPVIGESGNIIGIIKSVVNTEIFFKDIGKTRIGKSGHVLLVDGSNNIMFHPDARVSEDKFLSEEYRKQMSEKKTRWLVAPIPCHNMEKFFIVSRKITHPVLQGENIIWTVNICIEAREIFAPLRNLAYQAGLVFIVTVFLAIILSIGFSKILVRPIQELHEATEEISKGNLDYKACVKTGDEIEQLSDAFNLMVASLKKEQDELIYQKKFIESIILLTPDSLILMAPDTTIKSVNEATLKLLGYEEKELVGKSMQKILYEEPGEDSFHKYMEDIFKKGAAYNIGLTYLTKNGDRIPVSFSGSVFYESPGDGSAKSAAGIIGIGHDMRQTMAIINDLENSKRDIENKAKELTLTQKAMLNMMEDLEEAKSELEKSNKELRQLDRLKTDFVSMVSHELRTPLSITREGISLILDKVPGDINPKQEQLLAAAKNHIDRLARLIEELLDISRIDSGRVELKKEPTDIVSIARSAIASFEHLIKEKNLELKFSPEKETIEMNIDTDRTMQIFTNLIDNAIKFTDKGSINIAILDGDSKVKCIVEDTGIGISEDNLPKVFGRFQQFSRVAGPGPKGTGLGLSIAKGLVELHSGEIWVESKIGLGTKFTFTLSK